MGRTTHSAEPFYILGLESSCDETAAAILRSDGVIVAERLASQIATHRATGGVVPEVAARAHLEQIDGLIQGCLFDAQLRLDDMAAIAATAGPGLIGGVMVGMVTGKALAAATGKPFLAINHLAAHALSPRLVAEIPFPYVLLLVSGGHCQLLLVTGVDRFRKLGTTLDDAAGEAFDKAAKLLGLGYPGGPAVEAAAKIGDATRFRLPVPLLGRPDPDFSFSGLKTALRVQLEKLIASNPPTTQDIADLAAGFQAAVVAALVDRTARALDLVRADGILPNALVAAGGVAANQAIRAALVQLAGSQGLPFTAPPLRLCTDNAAMVAWTGIERLRAGTDDFVGDDLSIRARPRWPLDEAAAAVGAKA